MQCYLRCSRQHCIRKNPVQCCLNNTLGTTLHRSKSYAMLSERHFRKPCIRKNPIQCRSNTLDDNIAQVKILCNLVRDTPDNISIKKILFNVVLILLGQHCTGKNPMQCCPRGSRQLCIDTKKCCAMLS